MTLWGYFGSALFSILTLVTGFMAFDAQRAGRGMPNGHGGTMTYVEGYEETGFLSLLAAVYLWRTWHLTHRNKAADQVPNQSTDPAP
jgi:uncharacterized membrane protein